MKVALAVHAWPRSGAAGGSELHVRALARGLVERGHAVLVIAGSLERARGDEVELERGPDPDSGATVVRVRRPDLYFDHWHKGLSPAVTAAVRRLLAEERPALLHVHHWLRLSRDLVLAAAREGVPAVVGLHDSFVSCPLVFRALPADARGRDARGPCARAAGPHPCVACAGKVAPRTPWVEQGQGFVLFAERQAALQRELDLARAVVVPSEAHRAALEEHLGLGGRGLVAEVVPPAHRAEWPLEPGEADTGGALVLASWAGAAPHKGAELLVEAVGRVRAAASGAGPEVRLLLAGSGTEALADAGDFVRAFGPFEPEALFGHPVARADVMVSGSLAMESYGLVHDEALGLGLPAILPDAGAFAERAGKGVRLYRPGVVDALVEAVLELADPDRRAALRTEARAARAGLPTAGVAVERLLRVYAEAVEAGPPDPAELPPEDWFARRMGEFALEQWDAALAGRSAEELGLA